MNRSAPDASQESRYAYPGPGRGSGKIQRHITDGSNKPKDDSASCTGRKPGAGPSLGGDGGSDPDDESRGTPGDCTDADDGFEEQIPAEADRERQPVPSTVETQKGRPNNPWHRKQESRRQRQDPGMAQEALCYQGDGNKGENFETGFHESSCTGSSVELWSLISHTD